MEKKCNKAKWLSREALQIAVKRREVKNTGEKERYKHLNTKKRGPLGGSQPHAFSLLSGLYGYNYTVEMGNRFKGLDLIECLMNYGWRFVTLYRKQGSRPFPWKRNAKK